MFEEQIKGNSIIHRLDPRIKIIYAFIFSLVIALQNSLVSSFTGLIISIVMVALGRIELREILKRVLVVDEFILVLWIILPLTYPGDRLFKILGLNFSYQGILFALLLTIKANAIMLILICLLATSSIFEIVHGMIHLRIPEKMVFLFFLMYRYLYVLFDEYEKILRAMRARGFRFRTSLHTYRTIAYLFGCLLVRSYNRSETLYRAMVLRGWTGKFWLLDHFKFSFLDVLAVFLFTFANIAILIPKCKILI